ncbi:MAG: glycosyltransferase family 2 protein [Bacteroidota bacterium]
MINFGRLRKHALQRRKITAPTEFELLGIRFMIVLGLIAMTVFLVWFIDPDHIGYFPLYVLLTLALGFRLIKMLHEWYHYSSISVPEMPETDKEWTVDMVTTFCPGEPYDMIINTLKAMKAVKYPHKTYLCDEGNDPYMIQICEELGVIHSYRGEDKTHAKAGNVNYCLRNHCDGEIVVILDPDHEPTEDFLDRVIPYFENEEIGYVQCVQAYGNQNESFVAKGAAEQTYHFYGPMMMSMNSYGTVQAIGANCTFRRSALDSIGGHAAGLSEDMHTAMQLHAKGWKSIYVPEQLTRGLVPASAGAYWKQQLKWSRGTFELLFRVYPKLFKKLSWPQRLHYATIPLFFLHGLIGLIDILVPIFSLFLARVPWHMDLILFGKIVIPLLVLNMLIRQFAQRWMLEEHERGFHVLGGILLASTWWIHLVGFIYAIFKIKVPYIPTPKDDEPQNAWKLSIPNILMIILSIAAIVYGLSIDWNPYSFAMAFFAGINVVILSAGVWIAQQKAMLKLYSWIGMDDFITGIRSFWWNLRHYVLYRLIRNGSFILTILLIGALTGYTFYEKQQTELMRNRALQGIEQVRWFYSGIGTSNEGDELDLNMFHRMQDELQVSFDIVNFPMVWDGNKQLPIDQLESLLKNGNLPMINFQPKGIDIEPNKEEIYPVFTHILEGKFDAYIHDFAVKLRELNQPVFLSFAGQPDLEGNPWYSEHPEAAEVYKETWKYMVQRFVEKGASNVVWLWEPGSSEKFSSYYPGNNYVQWLGITVRNEGHPKDKENWDSFDDVYEDYHTLLQSEYALSQKPVMISRLEAKTNSGEQEIWLNDAFLSIGTKYPEIRSVLFFRDGKKKTQYDYTEKTKLVIHKHLTSSEPFIDKPPYLLNQEIREEAYVARQDRSTLAASIQKVRNGGKKNDEPLKIQVVREGKNFQLLIDDQPFYIKGIAYNPTHGWRDGFLPLTRRQLEMDFSRVKAMGANTIRRFGAAGIYDWNILRLAEEQDLKVLYGAWFDPAIDYYFDTAAVRKYEQETLDLVYRYKDSPAILGWVLGDETWSSQEFRFQQPYLTKTRWAYVRMIERLAKKIHEIDPNRPVMTALEHGKNLAGTLQDFRTLAPSLDMIGVNSYYGERIEELDSVFQQFDPERPYFLSAFGPQKYWDPGNKDFDPNSIPHENSSYEKAKLYSQNWKKHIESKRGNNVGGIAFCWQDRMEGTATWFGITDFKGRLKPSYYALKNAWMKQHDKAPLYEAYIAPPDTRMYRGGIYTFKAITENNHTDKDLKYEWYLLREKYLDDSGDISVVDGGKQVRIQIPNDYYDYRVYLYISDKDGNVVTSSQGVELNN